VNEGLLLGLHPSLRAASTHSILKTKDTSMAGGIDNAISMLRAIEDTIGRYAEHPQAIPDTGKTTSRYAC
jgi:hypothetical protein